MELRLRKLCRDMVPRSFGPHTGEISDTQNGVRTKAKKSQTEENRTQNRAKTKAKQKKSKAGNGLKANI